MTVLSTEYNISPMQSFQKDTFYEARQCTGYSNKIESPINTTTTSMSVGNSVTSSTTSASANASSSSSSSTTTYNNNDINARGGAKAMGKRSGKRPGRKPAKIDERAKLERSRQSAKECRARKKLRYQYLEELVLNREKAVFSLREELEMCKVWCRHVDKGTVPRELTEKMASEREAEMSTAMTSLSPSPDSVDLAMVDFSSEFSFKDINANDNSDA